MENELTKASVLRALEGPVVQRDDLWRCRICDRGFPIKQSVGVHELVHRREVGLAPPPRSGNMRKAPREVVCRYVDYRGGPACTDRMLRPSLPAHLQGGKHQLTRDQAAQWGRQRLEEDLNERTPVLVEVEPEPAQPAGSVLTDISAWEAVTGILAAARSDGLIPTRLLPMVGAVTEHIEALLTELRELTERNR